LGGGEYPVWIDEVIQASPGYSCIRVVTTDGDVAAFQPWLLDLATHGRLLLINYNQLLLLIKITDKIKIHYKRTQIPF
jgi:hypothetical protein